MEESVDKLKELYPSFKEIEWKLDCLETEVKRRFEESNEEEWNIDGLLVTKKVRPMYAYDDSFYDYLDEERALLPRAVKITSHLEKTYHLSNFQTPGVPSLSLSAFRNAQKTQEKKQAIKEFSEYLEKEEFDRVINMMKVFKMKFKKEKQKYEQIKKEVTSSLLSSGDTELSVDEVGNFRLTETGAEYDIGRIFSELSHRYLAFAYRAEGNAADIINLFNGETFRFTDQCVYDDCELTVQNGVFLAEGNAFRDVIEVFNEKTQEMEYLVPVKLKKKEEKSYLEAGYSIGYAKVSADPYKFFRKCEISGTKLTQLMDEGILLPKEVEPYRRLEKEIPYIEIIEEVKNEERRQHFYNQLMDRAQNIRSRNESTVRIDNLDDYLEDSM